jgi:hypothetical protein
MKTLRRRVRELEVRIEKDKRAFDERIEELSEETIKGARRKPLAPYLLAAERAGAHW